MLGFEVDFINSVQFSNHTQYNSFRGQRLDFKELKELYSGLKENNLIDYTHLLTGDFILKNLLMKNQSLRSFF